jgi:hypothetical protein
MIRTDSKEGKIGIGEGEMGEKRIGRGERAMRRRAGIGRGGRGDGVREGDGDEREGLRGESRNMWRGDGKGREGIVEIWRLTDFRDEDNGDG